MTCEEGFYEPKVNSCWNGVALAFPMSACKFFSLRSTATPEETATDNGKG